MLNYRERIEFLEKEVKFLKKALDETRIIKHEHNNVIQMINRTCAL